MSEERLKKYGFDLVVTGSKEPSFFQIAKTCEKREHFDHLEEIYSECPDLGCVQIYMPFMNFAYDHVFEGAVVISTVKPRTDSSLKV